MSANGKRSTDARLLIPPLDPQPWPTVGPEVCDWIEDSLVHGPGDVLGDPIRLTDEVRLFLYRAYEVFPRDHPRAGHRRFKRIVLSRRKGWAKTELAAWLAIAEMDPTAPVRCDGWHREGREYIPVGRPVRDPYVAMVATTEDQTEDLAYGAVRAILTQDTCAIGRDYDAGIERIVHKRAPGSIQPLASAPSARDGARTTFEHFDETHLFVGPRLKRTHATMLRNIPKRLIADAWGLETTTMYKPGEASVAELAHAYALQVAAGRVADPTLLFDHLQASERWDIGKLRELRAALREASGDAWPWTDAHGIVNTQFRDPGVHENDARRFYLNQKRKGADRWIDPERWGSLAAPKRTVPEGCRIVLGFDGSYSRDASALIGCTVEERPHLFVLRTWEKPLDGGPGWRVRRTDVDDGGAEAMEIYDVAELAPDPPGWHREIEAWEDAYGETVVRFETLQPKLFGPACEKFHEAIADGTLSHDGSEVLARHVANCVPENRRGYVVVTKSEPDSPDKIDAAVAAIVAHDRASWRLNNDDEELAGVLVDIYAKD